jgi:predicted nucleic acid-binding protein
VDIEAALILGRLVSHASAQGRRPDMADAQIAAVAARERMAVATRDVTDFEPFAVPLVNPWRGS